MLSTQYLYTLLISSFALESLVVLKTTTGMPGVHSNSLAPKQSGGYIPHTGMYNLHAGETVVPANQSFTSSPTINIYTSGGVDSFSLNQIQDIIARELASISRR